MASEWTLHTGGQGEEDLIHVQWYDHNNIRQQTDVKICIRPQDKPRTLEIWVNGVICATLRSTS